MKTRFLLLMLLLLPGIGFAQGTTAFGTKPQVGSVAGSDNFIIVQGTGAGAVVRLAPANLVSLQPRLSGVFATSQGTQSFVDGVNGAVAGGSNNVVHGLESVIAGGGGNFIEGNRHSTIAGGNHNFIMGNTEPDRGSFIGGGEYNYISNSSAHSVIAGGLSNVTDNARYSFEGAWKSKIFGKQANGASNSANVSGWLHTNEVKNSVICGGYQNMIQYTNNLADPNTDQEGNFIGGGWNHIIRGGYGSAIVGGYSNTIYSTINQRMSSAFIGAGIENHVGEEAYYSAIVDGIGCFIGGTAASSFIGGGRQNGCVPINGESSMVICGGEQNTNRSGHGIIGAGQLNRIDGGNDSAILGGFYNYLFGDQGNQIIIGSHLTNDFLNGGSDFRIDLGFDEKTKTMIDVNGMTVLGTLRTAGGIIGEGTAGGYMIMEGTTKGSTEFRPPVSGETNVVIFDGANPAAGQGWRIYSVTRATGSNIITMTNVAVASVTNIYEFALSDEVTDITTGTAKVTWRAPHAMTIVGVRASLSTASSSGIPTVDINEAGTTILSTKLTIDASEKTSTTAATAAVISDASIADDAEVTFDVDVAGTGARGLKVKIYYTR